MLIGGATVLSTPPLVPVKVSDLPIPFVVAHRGGSNIGPENTMEAYRQAISMGCQAIEMDVQKLSDGNLGIMHDDTVDRTTTGTGDNSLFNTAAWKNLTVDAGSWFNASWGNLNPPLFDDVLAAFGGRVVLFVEVKDADIASLVVSKILAAGLKDSCMVMSFTWSALSSAVAAGIPSLCLTNSESSIPSILATGAQYVGHASTVSQAYVQSLVSNGLKPIVFTINRRSEMDSWLSVGDIGIVSDDPIYIAHKHTVLTHDPFNKQTFYHGHLQAAVDRGQFVGGNRWGFPTSGVSGNYVLAGWGSPIAYDNYSIEATITFDIISDATKWGSLFVCCPDDRKFDNSAIGNGYHLLFRSNGQLSTYKATNGVGTLIGNSTSNTAVAQGGTARVRVDVTPTTVTFSRLDVPKSMVIPDTAYRGKYFHLCRYNNGVTFSDVTITPA